MRRMSAVIAIVGMSTGAVLLPGLARADVGIGATESVSAPGVVADGPVAVLGPRGRAWAAFTARDAASGAVAVQVVHRRTGLGWTAPTVLSTPGVDASSPTIAANGQGTVCLTWIEESWAQSRLRVACRVAGAWEPSQELGPLASRIESVSLTVDPDGRAAVAFIAVSSDLTSAAAYVVTRDAGRWAAVSTLDHVNTAVDSLSDISVVIGTDGHAVAMWHRDAELMASRARSTEGWSTAFVAFSGPSRGATLTSTADRIVGAWLADGLLWTVDLAPALSAMASHPVEPSVEQLALVSDDSGHVFALVAGDDGGVRLQDLSSDDDSMIVMVSDSPGRIWSRVTAQELTIAVADDTAALDVVSVRLQPSPLVTGRSIIEGPASAPESVALHGSRALLVWVDGPLHEVRAARAVLDEQVDVPRGDVASSRIAPR